MPSEPLGKSERVSIRELNRGASAVINRVHETGEPVVITRYGKAWARIVPIEEPQSPYERLLRQGRIKSPRKVTPPTVIPVKTRKPSSEALIEDREERF